MRLVVRGCRWCGWTLLLLIIIFSLMQRNNKVNFYYLYEYIHIYMFVFVFIYLIYWPDFPLVDCEMGERQFHPLLS